MGVWITGDYRVSIPLRILESSFRSSAKNYLTAASTYTFADSSGSAFYHQTSKRYQLAAEQVADAANGFDLRDLVVYHGTEDEKENAGNSSIVEGFIMQLIRNGNAIVCYRERRVFVLKNRFEVKGEELLQRRYENRIYFDDAENYLFKESHHLGW